jgi:hypothetical protein
MTTTRIPLPATRDELPTIDDRPTITADHDIAPLALALLRDALRAAADEIDHGSDDSHDYATSMIDFASMISSTPGFHTIELACDSITAAERHSLALLLTDMINCSPLPSLDACIHALADHPSSALDALMIGYDDCPHNDF